MVVFTLTVAVAEPAQAERGKGPGEKKPEAKGVGQGQPPGLVGNDHAQAKGHEKKADEAPADLGVSIPEEEPVDEPAAPTGKGKAKAKPRRGQGQAQGGGQSSAAHHHVIVCHRTGSASNPYVVLNIPWTAWSGAHDPGSSHAHPPLDGHVDILLADPASRPGTKDGFTKGDCRGDDPAPPPPPVPPSTPSGGVSGGALGTAAGGTGRGQLPFTGFPLLFVLLASLGVAVGAAGIARRAGKEGQSL
jgi:hypothetical protein